MPVAERTVLDRFTDAVDVADNGCWLWTGRVFTDTGYPVFPVRLPDGRWRRAAAHRVSYELFVGPIPDGLVLDHLCVNKLCVCPEHLEPVTQDENRRRQTERQTHCRRGHPLAGDNLYTYVRHGGVVTRHCRACRRLADHRHGARQRKARAA